MGTGLSATDGCPIPFSLITSAKIGECNRIFYEATPVMKIAEIKRAVDEGLKVHWQNREYGVISSSLHSRYLIRSIATGHCIGLTWADGVTLNG